MKKHRSKKSFLSKTNYSHSLIMYLVPRDSVTKIYWSSTSSFPLLKNLFPFDGIFFLFQLHSILFIMVYDYDL